MRNVPRKLAFVLASTNHGAMIVNRFDYHMKDGTGQGVGFQILESGHYDPQEVEMAVQLLALRRRYHGDGVVAIDCGANIGVHTVEWATAMTGWGTVMAIEAQERLYYALAGNIAINNCFNATAKHVAVAAEAGIMNIPMPNYTTASSFGSLELRQSASNEFIGQKIDYSEGKMVTIEKLPLDQLKLARVDLIKIDIEGMELEALEGARQTIEKNTPVLLVESIKAGPEKVAAWLEGRGYKVMGAGINLLAIHSRDPMLREVKMAPPPV
jgi:FkbM family methyltransferase